jgi:hypothetical protein
MKSRNCALLAALLPLASAFGGSSPTCEVSNIRFRTHYVPVEYDDQADWDQFWEDARQVGASVDDFQQAHAAWAANLGVSNPDEVTPKCDPVWGHATDSQIIDSTGTWKADHANVCTLTSQQGVLKVSSGFKLFYDGDTPVYSLLYWDNIPECRNDAQGDLAANGLSCEILMEMTGNACELDLNTINPAAPPKYFLYAVCPVSCNRCEEGGNQPWKQGAFDSSIEEGRVFPAGPGGAFQIMRNNIRASDGREGTGLMTAVRTADGEVAWNSEYILGLEYPDHFMGPSFAWGN